ncbi:ribonuclease H-like domain-containing protein, partial [Tanacetum coccineum]
REESHRGITPSTVKTDKPQVSTFVSRLTDNNINRSNNLSNNGNNVNKGNYDSRLCKNYGLKGHTVDRCFELTGYPPGFKRNPNLKPENSFNNTKNDNVEFKKGSVGSNESKTSAGSVSFTNDQVMKLMSLLNEKSCSTAQANMAVGHPNGTLAQITHVGNLKLNNDVVLFDVLVVHEYYDLKKGRVLYIGSEFGGLYVFYNDFNKCDSVNQIFPYKMGYSKTDFESESDILNLNFFDLVKSETQPKTYIPRPNDEEEGPSGSRDGSMHQLTIKSGDSRKDPVHNNPTSETRYDDLHTATPVDENTHSEGNIVPLLEVPIFQNNPEIQTEDSGLRRSKRSSKLLDKLNDYILDKSVKYGLSRYANHNVLSVDNYCFVSNMNKSSEPSSFEEASKDINWINAMKDEISTLYENDTWELMELPIVQKGWKLFKMDVNNAFLYGNLNKKVYILPLLFFKENDNKVCILKKSLYGLKQALRPIMTPLPENCILSHKESDGDKYLRNVTSYQKLVGKLIYLTMTRPDISYDVHCLSQLMHAPLQSHFDIGSRVLKYLKLAPGSGIGFSKSDSGIKVETLSKSSTEVEYMAKASATCEVIWVLKVLQDLDHDRLTLVTLYCKNKSAIQITTNPVVHEKTKHFNIDVHLVCRGFVYLESAGAKEEICAIKG